VTQEPAAAPSSGNGKPVRFILFGAWIAMAVGCFQPFYLTIFRLDVPTLRAQWTELPYRKTPGLRRAVVEVARRTPKGARILLWTPQQTWEGGYDYAFRRAQYLLAGRELLPMLVDGRDAVDPGSARAAQYIACWPQCPPTPPGFAVVWKGESGTLLRRAP
jgi:hypothetical protein